MEIRQLKYFVEICRCKSFSQAASLCFISPQGMSMSMMRLEEELGCKLFVRSPIGIALTPHAEFLLPKAKKILSIAAECETYFSSGKVEDAIIPLYCSHGTIEEYAGEVLHNFHETYPEIKIQTKECSDLDADDAILSGDCEIALTVGPLPENRFTSSMLFSTDYVLLVSSAEPLDPLARRESVAIKDLKDLPIAVMHSGVRTYSYLRTVCAREGFEPNIHTFADNILLVYYMATLKGTYGISTRALFTRLNPPGVTAVKIDDPDFRWNVYAVRKKDSSLSAPAELFWKALSPKKKG